MGTIRQKKLAQGIVDNLKRKKPLNKIELLDSVGYAKNTQRHTPSIIINQKGVQEELKILGFDEESAKEVVSEIMLDKKKDANARLKATDQVFKVVGSYAPEKTESKVVIETLSQEEKEALLALLNK